MADKVIVHGYRDMLRACDRAGKETKKEVRGAFRKVGDAVKVPWSRDMQRFGNKTATGIRSVVRARGVSVEQTRRKTTGTRRDFALHQQRIGDSILASKEHDIVRDFDQAMDRVADHFDDR